MADLNELGSTLCIIPPKHLWPQIDRVRSRYDRNFPNWPPHIKLVYPFVPIDKLAIHLGRISEALEHFGRIRVRLGATDHIHNEECFLHVEDAEHIDEEGARTFPLDRLCEAVIEAVPSLGRGSWYRSMTVGHALESEPADEVQSLLQRAGLLSGLGWEVDELHVLVTKASTSGPSPEGSHMVDWASISLIDGGLRVHQKRGTRLEGRVVNNKAVAGRIVVPDVREFYSDHIPQPPKDFIPFFYDGVEWIPSTPNILRQRSLSATQRTLSVASFNVLGRTDNLALLTYNILHYDAEADILVLQETTGILLSHLLHNKRMQDRYAFCTHPPFNQDGLVAGPDKKMVVVLSKYAFHWETIPLPSSGYETESRCWEENEDDQVGHNDLSTENGDVVKLVKHSAAVNRMHLHNRALLVEFRRSEDSAKPLQWNTFLALAAFHLTPGRDKEDYFARASELNAIIQYIYCGTPAVLAGGFNMPTSTVTLRYHQCEEDNRRVERDLFSSGYVDAWMVARMARGAETDDDPVVPKCHGEQGPTDDTSFPGTVVWEDWLETLHRRPHRFDRILVKPNGLLSVQSFNKFGKLMNAGEEVLVDNTPLHLGVRAVVKLERKPRNQGASSLIDSNASSLASHLGNGLPPHLKEHESVLEALRDVDAIPPLAEWQLRERAFEALRVALLAASPHHEVSGGGGSKVNLVILPIGSYGLDVWTQSSDLDCLCLGTFSLPTFIDLAIQRIQQAADSGIKLVQKKEDYMGTTLKLVFEHHLGIDLTYARSAWPLLTSDPTTPLPNATLLALKPYRDLDYIQRSIPDIADFRVAHRFIKKWAEGRGIYSTKFGYLNGIQITMLLTRVHKRLVTNFASPMVPEILFTFFKEYANFNWKEDIVFDECFHKTLTYSRTSQEPLAILSYFPPRLNTSPTATISSVRTITAEFQRAANLLDQSNATWADLLRVSLLGTPTSGSLASDEFLQCHQYYAKVDVQYWGGVTTKGRGFVARVESLLASLLAYFNECLLDVHFRVWPTRYQEDSHYNSEQSQSAVQQGEYHGVYIFGFDWIGKAKKGVANPGLPDARKIASNLNFTEQYIRKNDRCFDAAFMNIHYEIRRTLVPTSAIGKHATQTRYHELQLDHRNWDVYIQHDLKDTGEDRELGQATTVQSEWSPSSKSRKRSATNKPHCSVELKPPVAGKFRTAADVVNRLRWDASYDHNDFVVGYEDRFLGTMERELDVWTSEQTHEEFIPQHRILYFKRHSDGQVVWERATRVDLVFGSSEQH